MEVVSKNAGKVEVRVTPSKLYDFPEQHHHSRTSKLPRERSREYEHARKTR